MYYLTNWSRTTSASNRQIYFNFFELFTLILILFFTTAAYGTAHPNERSNDSFLLNLQDFNPGEFQKISGYAWNDYNLSEIAANATLITKWSASLLINNQNQSAVFKQNRIVLPPVTGSYFPGVSGYDDPGKTSDPAGWRTDEFNADWGLAAIKAEYAYARGFTGKGVKLGLVDTGTWRGHPEFSSEGKLVGLFTLSQDGVILDGGLPQLRNYSTGPALVNHGTHVGGTMAAQRDGNGMHGVAFNSQLYSAVAGKTGLTYSGRTSAFNALIENNVRVINNSWGTTLRQFRFYVRYSDGRVFARYNFLPNNGLSYYIGGRVRSQAKSLLYDTIEKATRSDVVIVFSAGNQYSSIAFDYKLLPYYKADYDVEDNYITVAALDNPQIRTTKIPFSDICGFAKFWCVSAPGSHIYSGTVTGSSLTNIIPGYRTGSGTSMAAPHVSGSLGLVMERYPYMTSAQARNVLVTTSDHLAYNQQDLENSINPTPIGSCNSSFSCVVGDFTKRYQYYEQSDFGLLYRIDNSIKVPNEAFGWGLINIARAMDGPGQLLGEFEPNLPAGVYDIWKNDISDEAIHAYRDELADEVAEWNSVKDTSEWQDTVEEHLNFTYTQAELLEIFAKYYEYKEARASMLATRQWYGSLTKRGAGILSLRNSNTYAGPTRVAEGVLDLHGKTGIDSFGYIKSQVIVEQAGSLQGNADLGSDLTVNGQISPGSYVTVVDNKPVIVNRVGDINVAGQYTQGPGSIYHVDVDPSGNDKADLIRVKSAAIIDPDARVVATKIGTGKLKLGDRYPILASSAGVSGRYHDDIGLKVSAFVDGDLFYDPDTVYLGIARTRDFADVGQTINERNTATGLQSLSGSNRLYAGNKAYNSFAMLANDSDARAALNMLSGELHASVGRILFGDTNLTRQAIVDRLKVILPLQSAPAPDKPTVRSLSFAASAKAPKPVTSQSGNTIRITSRGMLAGSEVWISGIGSLLKVEGDNNAAAIRSRTSGIMVGIDRRFSSGGVKSLTGRDRSDRTYLTNWRFGLLAGYSRSSVDGRHGNADIDNYHGGVYGGATIDRFGIMIGAVYTHHKINSRRYLAFGDFYDSPRADYSGNTAQLFVRGDYRLDLNRKMAITPFGELGYIYSKNSRFSERGGDAILHGRANELKSLFSTLGVKFEASVGGSKLPAKIEITAGWRHSFNKLKLKARSGFAGGQAFMVHAPPITRDAFVGGVNLKAMLSRKVQLNIGYSGELGKKLRNQRLNVGLSIKF